MYIQAGWSWSNWRFRNNYFELPFLVPAPTAPIEQSFIHIVGNGSSDKNHHFSNNLGRFLGDFFPPGIPNYSLRMKGIDGVTVMDNLVDADASKTYGKAEFIKAESTSNNLLLIETLTKRGNRNLYEKPIQTLLDDFHEWGSQQTLSLNNGYPLPGTSYQFSDATHITAQGVDFRDELRPGDLLATDSAGALGGKPGPFYVVSISSASLATVSRTAAGPFPVSFTATVRRYRGPMAYQSAAGLPVFNVMNDGSVAIGGIPANFGFGEFSVNGKATITGQVRASNGSAAAPAVSFTADTGTGFFRPAADAVGLVTSGVERARVTSAGLQLGNVMSLGFGTSTSSSDTFLVHDDGASALALRNVTAAQTFRVYENYGSSANYARLSFNAQPAGYPGSYQIRSEAGGTGTLRSLQVGTGPRSGTNQPGLDTFLHAGQGTGSATGGAILFQYAPAGSAGSAVNGLQTAWQIGTTGHLTAGDAAKMIKWGTSSSVPAIKATSSSNPDLQIRRGDDSSGAALLFRLSVAPKTVTTYTLNESENNRTFTNEGATGPVTFILPTGYSTNIGFHCHFAVVVGQPFTIRASDSSTIRIGNPITTGTPASINTSTPGNTIHLVCLNSNKWVALSHEGTWSGVS